MITTITPEQEARFAEWRERWIRIGLSTEPADFEKAEKAALRAYKLCGLEPPKVILRMESPFGITVGGAMAWLAIQKASGISSWLSLIGIQKRYEILHRLSKHLTEPLWQQLLQQVEYQVRNQAWQHVFNPVEQTSHRTFIQVRNKLWREVEHEVEQHVDYPVWSKVREQVWLRIWHGIRHQVRRQIGRELDRDKGKERALINTFKTGLDIHHGGAFWAGWCAYVTFLRDVLGWQDPILESFSIDEDLTTSCGWVLWHQDVLAISDRPSEIHLDAEGRLHNESGPSIAYRDGWKLYHVHGVAVPDFVVERPDRITVEHILCEPNAEVRRVMLSRMGIERFIRESDLQPVHSDDFGTLYRAWMPGDEPLVVVKVVNSTPKSDGSRNEYFLRVPPTMQRAREAVAWTFGMEEKDYLPNVET